MAQLLDIVAEVLSEHVVSLADEIAELEYEKSSHFGLMPLSGPPSGLRMADNSVAQATHSLDEWSCGRDGLIQLRHR
ncbi:hypothetical protein ACS4RR_020105 [Rhizobium sp. Z1P35]